MKPAIPAAAILLLVGCGTWRPPTPPVPSPPQAIFVDHLDAPAHGRPELPDRQDIVHIHSYSLNATLPPTPSDGIAYAVDPTLAPAPQLLAKALGLTAAPMQAADEVAIGPVTYYPEAGAFQYSLAPGGAAGRLAGPFKNEGDVVKAAGNWLVEHRLFSKTELDSMTASATHVANLPPPNQPFWSVHLGRTLDSVPDYGFWAAGASFQVAEDGSIHFLIVVRHPIGGSLRVPVISPAAAWAEILANHWYAADGVINNGRLDIQSFAADHVELCYRENEVNQFQPWLVPMWCFRQTDASGVNLVLYYPAADPGSFDCTMPDRR